MEHSAQTAAAVGAMWAAFVADTGVSGQVADAYAFGDSPEQQDRLGDLVVHGPKRASAALLVEYEEEGEPLPIPGQYWAVLDGRAHPIAIIRTTDVRVAPVREVDDAFAWDEGEGDRTLADWRRGHDAYFTRQCARIGVPYTDDLDVVMERFELVWPTPPAPNPPVTADGDA